MFCGTCLSFYISSFFEIKSHIDRPGLSRPSPHDSTSQVWDNKLVSPYHPWLNSVFIKSMLFFIFETSCNFVSHCDLELSMLGLSLLSTEVTEHRHSQALGQLELSMDFLTPSEIPWQQNTDCCWVLPSPCLPSHSPETSGTKEQQKHFFLLLVG